MEEDNKIPTRIFSKHKKYNIRIRLSPDTPILTYKNTTVLDETDNLILVLHRYTGKGIGYAKSTILHYEEAQEETETEEQPK